MSFDVLRLPRLTVCLWSAVLLSGPPITAAPPLTRLPPPDAATQARALRQIKEIHDYSKAVTPALKIQLAKKMVVQAAETKDDAAGRFMLLSEARDLAVLAGELEVAFGAIEELNAIYAVDAIGMQADVLQTVKFSSRMAHENKALVERALAAMNAAAIAGRFDVAKKLSVLAASTQQKVPNAEMAKTVLAATKSLVVQQTQYEAAQQALATLKNAPDDAAANLAAGRYFCFFQDDWERGLPRLAKGSNAALAEAAKIELARPVDARKQVELADKWWDAAEKEPEPTKKRLSIRAGMWYERGLPTLKGFEKTKVERRMATIGPLPRTAEVTIPDPPVVVESEPAHDLTDGLVGYWKFDERGGDVVNDAVGQARGKHSGQRWGEGKFGQAAHLDGDERYIGFEKRNFGESFTIALWCKPISNPQRIVGLVSNKRPGEKSTGFALFINTHKTGDGAVILETGNDEKGLVVKSAPNTIRFGEWSHVAAVVDRKAGQGAIFVNGIKVAEGRTVDNFAIESDYWRFGSLRSLNVAEMFPLIGSVDDARHYKRLLSAPEIAALAK